VGSKPVGISGSRAAAILGLSEYQSIFEAFQVLKEEFYPGWNAAQGYAMPEPPDNAAIRWGSCFEDAILDLASAARGQAITEREHFYQREYMTCHIDGLYADGPMHEGKSTSIYAFWEGWGTPGTDRIPQNYQVQCQHNTMLSERDVAVVSVLAFPRRVDEWEEMGIVPKNENGWYLSRVPAMNSALTEWPRVMEQMGFFQQYIVPAKPSLQQTLREMYADFMGRYIHGDAEPEITTYQDIRRAFIASVGTIVATEQLEGWASEYRLIGEEIGGTGRLAHRREELRVLILKGMRAADSQLDDESREKTILRDRQGKKLASWDGKTFR
jgi:hypothetical protein